MRRRPLFSSIARSSDTRDAGFQPPRDLTGSYSLSEPLQILFVTAVSFLIYLNSLNGVFVFDDHPVVANNKDVLPSTPLLQVFLHDYWGADMTLAKSHKSYRPLTILSFRLNYLLHGFDVLGYHFLNVALHAINSVMIHRLISRYVRSSADPVALVASLSFAAHPIHTESVASIANRAEVLAAAFFLSSLLCYLAAGHARSFLRSSLLYLAAIVLIGATCLAKEVGFTLPAVLALLELLGLARADNSNTPARFFRVLLLLSFGLSLAALRWYAFGASREALHAVFAVENRVLAAGGTVRALTWAYLPAVNFFLLVWPASLSADYSFDCIPFVTSVFDLRNLASLALYLSILALSLLGLWFVFRGTVTGHHHRRWLLFGSGWIVLTFLPASNLLLPVGFVVAERVLYTPSIGFSLLLGLLLSIGVRRAPRLSITIALFVLIFYCYLTVRRNPAWAGELPLWESALKVCPRSAKVLYSYGAALIQAGRAAAALPHLEIARSIDPDEHAIYLHEARAHSMLGHSHKALAAATRALIRQPYLRAVVSLTREQAQQAKLLDPALDPFAVDPATGLYYPRRFGGLLLAVGTKLKIAEFVEVAMQISPDLAGVFYKDQMHATVGLVSAGALPLPSSWSAPRGIVMCAGRLNYLVSAFITLHMLRDTGCTLPVEVFFAGKEELPPGALSWFRDIPGVRFIDATALIFEAVPLSGYQIKAVALLHSSFREVLLLDADNIPIADPSLLFDTDAYLTTGALFWPDYCGVQSLSRELWQLFELQPPAAEAEFPDPPFQKRSHCHDRRYQVEFESGQLIVDKSRTWAALQVALYMNLNHAYFYRHMHGDKDTFRLSFQLARAPYHLVSFPFVLYGQQADGGRICGTGVWGQRHPHSGEVLFVHNYKWQPSQLVQRGFGSLLHLAAFNYSSLSWEAGCGPLHRDRFYAPSSDAVTRSLSAAEALVEPRGREYLRRLWDIPSFQSTFCSTDAAPCQRIREGLLS